MNIHNPISWKALQKELSKSDDYLILLRKGGVVSLAAPEGVLSLYIIAFLFYERPDIREATENAIKDLEKDLGPIKNN